MTTSWTVSPILRPLIAEEVAHHPGMVWGTIGDEAHGEEESDHNPDQWHYVCAGDAMIGPHFTAADAEYLFDQVTAMIKAGDKRCAYAIYNRRIVSSTVQPGKVRPYLEEDPHTGHVHASVPHGSNPHPTTSWGIYSEDDVTQDQMETAAFLGVYDAFKAAAATTDDDPDNGDTPTGRQLRGFMFAIIDARLDAKLKPLEAKLDQLLAAAAPPPA